MAKKIQVGAGGKSVRANQEAAGIPDSRPFVAPEGEALPSGNSRLLELHIGGIQIRDMNLPPQSLAAMNYEMTDEGIEEKENRPMAREASGVTLGEKDDFTKALDQRRHEVKERDFPDYEARDPLKEVADKHAVPGMKAKFLSDKKVKHDGSTGDYEVVKNKDGDPVKVRGMLLGHTPVERAEARNRHYRRVGNEQLKQIGERYKKEGGKTAVADQ